MRDDLLDAQAGVDWAVEQLDCLKARLISWHEQPPYHFDEEPHPETGEKLIRFSEVKPPPPIVNAEVGVILNSIRSSLDVLVNTLASRAGHPASKQAYFPVCSSAVKFRLGKHAGSKAIKLLANADQAIIEDLEPWRGGKYPLLFALHELDIMRKHRRLISVVVEPYSAMIPLGGAGRGFKFPKVSAAFENDAIVATTGIEADLTQVPPIVAVDVVFNEAGPVSGKSVITALEEFASLVSSVIELFDKD